MEAARHNANFYVDLADRVLSLEPRANVVANTNGGVLVEIGGNKFNVTPALQVPDGVIGSIRAVSSGIANLIATQVGPLSLKDYRDWYQKGCPSVLPRSKEY